MRKPQGTRMRLFEAMALGVPVIATRGGAVEEIITNGENGLIVPPGDQNQLAGAVERNALLTTSAPPITRITIAATASSFLFMLSSLLVRRIPRLRARLL